PPPRSTLFPYTTLFRSGIQVEEISPSWLASGTNRIDFLPADESSPASYRVSALRIVGIPSAGARLDDGSARAWLALRDGQEGTGDRKSTRLNSSHVAIS